MKKFDYYLSKRNRGSNLEVFYGTLTPTKWNDKDGPIEFSLYTIDEADILLGSPQFKKKYLELINHPVEIRGERKVNKFGDEYISVRKIRKISYPQFDLLSGREKVTREFEIQEYTPLVALDTLEKYEYRYFEEIA